MCREQEGDGGLDRRSQIRPKVGNLRGERFTFLLLYFNIVYLFILLVQNKQEICQIDDPLMKASHGCVIDFDENGLFFPLLNSSAICSLKVSTSSSSFLEENTLLLLSLCLPPNFSPLHPLLSAFHLSSLPADGCPSQNQRAKDCQLLNVQFISYTSLFLVLHADKTVSGVCLSDVTVLSYHHLRHRSADAYRLCF